MLQVIGYILFIFLMIYILGLDYCILWLQDIGTTKTKRVLLYTATIAYLSGDITDLYFVTYRMSPFEKYTSKQIVLLYCQKLVEWSIGFFIFNLIKNWGK